MLGTLGSYAFDIIKRRLERALMHPLGFRVWRSIARLVKLVKPASPYKRELMDWVKRQLEQAEQFRGNSLYPTRCLDLELAMAIPPDWSPPGNDWAGRALLSRMNDASATVQERGTAAMGLWQRVLEQDGNRHTVLAALRPFIVEFGDGSDQLGPRHEMQWVANCLKYLISEDERIFNHHPRGADQPWLQHVDSAVRHLELQGIPENILPATATLFRQSLLQNAVIHRRRAIETMLAGGWTEPVTNALAKYLELERHESWLRARAEFALGFLERPDSVVAQCLADACTEAYANLTNEPTSAGAIELHAALFSIGDCFGAVGVRTEDVRAIRDRIRGILSTIANGTLTHVPPLYPVARAAAYVLAFTAQPRKNDQIDIAEELLVQLCSHPDRATSSLSNWALGNRLDRTTGDIVSLVHAKL